MASEGGKPKKKLTGRTRSIILTREQDERLDRLVEAGADYGVSNRNQLIRLLAEHGTVGDIRTMAARRDG